jgi:transposase InsO family protein
MDHLVLDRDPLFTAAFRRLLRDSGVKPLLLPARSPNLNAFADRFVLSIKSECLERMVLLGEAHLRTAAVQYLEHYHPERRIRDSATSCSSLTRRSSRTGP